MKKTSTPPSKPNPGLTAEPPLRIPYVIILVAYALVTVVTPNLGAYDSNGPKFLSFSLLNLLSFIFLLTQKELRADPGLQFAFFRNKIGIAYTLFMVVILLSFSKVINIPEAILTFSKYFTTFSAAYILSILLRFDKRYLKLLSMVMLMLLIIDCLTVYYFIFQYMSGQISGIIEIKSVYSNKNILVAAIFVKIPFALWFFTFEKGWLRKLGLFTVFCAFEAILLMSTRAFYLGLIFLIIFYGTFLIIESRRSKIDKWFFKPAQFFGAVILSFLLFSFIQHYLYPRAANVYNQSFTERLSTISAQESSSNARLESWKRSALLFKQDPLLGVGIGNWKIQILQYENPAKSDYIFMVKNHNDFIEVFTETGLIGGLLFVFIFILLLSRLIVALFKPNKLNANLLYIFLPGFGVLAYSFDAMFNFPADRPEMQSLFAVYFGLGIAFTTFPNKPFTKGYNSLTKMISLVSIIIIISTSYVLYLNYKSLMLQRMVKEDQLKGGALIYNSKMFMEEFPTLPNISIDGAQPIYLFKLQYLINEKKFDTLIQLARTDNSSPFDSRKEYYMAYAFFQKETYDSALIYAYKAHDLKPLDIKSLSIIANILEKKGRKNEAVKLVEGFVSKNKSTSLAWLYLMSAYLADSNAQKAVQVIDSAVKYLPNDSVILKEQKRLKNNIQSKPHEILFKTAMDYFNSKQYQSALKYLNEFISKEPGVPLAYARRAGCYFYFKEYSKCIHDVGSARALGSDTPYLINLRGTSYYFLGNFDLACKDFEESALKGDKDGITNLEKFCKGK